MKKFEYVFYYNAESNEDISIRDTLHEAGIKGISLLYIVNNYRYRVTKFFDSNSFNKNVEILVERGDMEMITRDLAFGIFPQTDDLL